MGIRLPVAVLVKQVMRLSIPGASKANSGVPKGCFPVYVGESQKERFVVPLSYLNHPSFQDLLRKAEEEFGFSHPTGGLAIPCELETFFHVTSQMN